MKLENPLFFFHGATFFPSSEYRLGVVDPDSISGEVGTFDLSPTEKLADCRRDGLIIAVFELICDVEL